jgi:hypothetical protein
VIYGNAGLLYGNAGLFYGNADFTASSQQEAFWTTVMK